MTLIRRNNTYKTTYLYARFSPLYALASTVQYSHTNNATQIQQQHIAQLVFKQIINKDFINLFTLKYYQHLQRKLTKTGIYSTWSSINQ